MGNRAAQRSRHVLQLAVILIAVGCSTAPRHTPVTVVSGCPPAPEIDRPELLMIPADADASLAERIQAINFEMLFAYIHNLETILDVYQQAGADGG